jgi:hypothetical protein
MIKIQNPKQVGYWPLCLRASLPAAFLSAKGCDTIEANVLDIEY